MNRTSVVGLALALTLGAAGSALAQGHNQGQRGGHQDNNDCRDGRGNCTGPDQRQRPHQNSQRPYQRSYQDRYEQQRPGPQHSYNDMQRGERGAGPDHAYYRGGRLPPEYRTRQYVVDDWRGHRLSAPPRGYHWVQNGGDYLLVAITTGVILQLLLGN